MIKPLFSRHVWLTVGAVIAVSLAALGAHLDTRARDADLLRADPEMVLSNPNLFRTALTIGRPAFARRCANCHGVRGEGNHAKAIPDLTDGDHLYASSRPEDIEQIILFGIRAGPTKGKNLASMPAYTRAQPQPGLPEGSATFPPSLTPGELDDVTQFVLSLSHHATDREAAERGKKIYGGSGGCYDCHSGDGQGDPAIGAPNLTDGVWLYGDGSAHAVAESIAYGRAGMCPAFAARITPLEARAIALYVASLAPNTKAETRL